MSDHIKFVLLSLARSGTTAFMSTLANHPGAYVHAAPFARKLEPRLRYRDDAFLAAHHEDDRESDPIAYVERVLDFSPDRKTVGFKMWLGQQKEACHHLMADTSVRKIILERKNLLAAYSSIKLAQIGGVWHSKSAKDKGATRPVLDFDADDFLDTVRKRTRVFAKYRNVSQGRVLDLGFSNLISEGIPRTVEFLGLPPYQLDAALQKVNTSDILSRFNPETHDEILRVLDEIGHPEWVQED